MKKEYTILGTVGVVVVLAVFGISFIKQDSLGSFNPQASTLLGSVTNAVSIPRELVFATATTTDSTNSFAAGAQNGYLDGGFSLQQQMTTSGFDKVRLDILAVGGTATSTLTIRQQLSHDGTTWYDLHASSTPAAVTYATSSPVSLTPTGIMVDPGTATTTYSFLFNTDGMIHTRFLFLADDLLADPNDGVQAFVRATKLEPAR